MKAEQARKQYATAGRLFGEGRYAEALALLEPLARAFPANADLALTMARCLAAMGRRDSAIALCRHVAEELNDERGKALERQLGVGRVRQLKRRTRPIGAVPAAQAQAQPPGPSGKSKRIRRWAVVSALVASVTLCGALLYAFVIWPLLFRSVIFPEEYSVGTLYRRGAETREGPWEELGEAQGRTVVSKDDELRLVMKGPSAGQGGALRSAEALSGLGRGDLRALDASSVAFGDEGLVHLKGLKGLDELRLDATGITDAGLSHLTGLVSLRTLTLSNNPIWGTELFWVTGLPLLERLDLSETEVGNSSLAELRSLVSLEVLSLPRRVTDAGLRTIGELTTLRELHLSGTAIRGRGLSYLAGLERLRVLDLSVTWTTASGVRRLRALKNLESLNLAHTRVNDRALVYLKALTSLRELDLTDTLVTDAGLAYVERLSGLERLRLESCCGESEITEAGVAALREALPACEIDFVRGEVGGTAFPEDRSLGMLWVRPAASDPVEAWARFGEARGVMPIPEDVVLRLDAGVDGGISRVRHLEPRTRPSAGRLGALEVIGLERLRSLRFGPQFAFDEEALAFISGLTGLEELEVSSNGVGDEFFAALEGKEGLRSLTLIGSDISGAGVAMLRGLTGLRALNLSETRLGDVGLPRLADLTSLRELNLRQTGISETGLGALAAMTWLERLDISENGLSPQAVAALREGLRETEVICPSSERVSLHFPDGPAMGVLWSRPRNATIGRVRLLGGACGQAEAWSAVGPAQGAVSVAADHALRLDLSAAGAADLSPLANMDVFGLHTLIFAGTKVEDASLQHIAGLKGLEVLDLFGTGVSDVGLGFVETLTGLRSLGLRGTGVTDAGLARLGALTSLRELDLAQTAVTDAGLEALSGFEQLERVFLEGAPVTAEGVERARLALPACRFSFMASRVPHERVTVEAPSARVVALASRRLGGWGLGRLQIRAWDSDDEGAWEDVGPLSHFETPIPARMALKLNLSLADAYAVGALASLPPDSVQVVEFAPGSLVRRETLSGIAHLRGLHELVLDFCTIGEGAFEALEGLEALVRLSLFGAEIEGWPGAPLWRRTRPIDGELAYLRGMPWLEVLDLSATGLSDRGLAHVGSLTGLRKLDAVNNPALSDTGLAYMKDLKVLEELTLNRTAVSDQGLEAVSAFAFLKSIDLYGTRVTQAGLGKLDTLEQLEEIYLDEARLAAQEVRAAEEAIRRMAASDEGITGAGLAEVAGVKSLREVIPDSLRALQRIALLAMSATDEGITSEGIAEVSGADSFDDVPAAELAGLQGLALAIMAQSETGITALDLAEVAGESSFEAIPRARRGLLQGMALTALADSATGITAEDIAALAGVTAFEEVPENALRRLQEQAFRAMADSATGIVAAGVAEVVGAESYDAIPAAERVQLQDMALHAMANSATGLTSAALAELVGAESFDALAVGQLDSLQILAMSALADSATGITTAALAALGGSETYEELPEDVMEGLQKLAFRTMADSGLPILSENLAAIGGAESFEELAPERLASLQTFALTAMADSDTGITPREVVELGGVESFEEFEAEDLKPLQVKALAAMSDSEAGITEEGIAVVSGAESFDALRGAELLAVQSQTLTAMARSRGGITPAKVGQFVGDAALEVVDLSYTEVRDEHLAYLTNLRALKQLDLAGCREVTDQGLAHFAGAASLERLNVRGTKISDAGLYVLDGMASLKRLHLNNTAVTDAGLAHVGGLASLEELALESTRIQGPGLVHVAQLGSLKALDLQKTEVSDDSMRYLSNLTALETLNLAFTPIGDAGLAKLGELASLVELELHDCANITDRGLVNLTGMQSLERLTLHATSVSDGAVRHLQQMSGLRVLYVNQMTFSAEAAQGLEKALPNCRIRRVRSPQAPRTIKPDALETPGERGVETPDDYGSYTLGRFLAGMAYVGSVLVTLMSTFFVPFLPYFRRVFSLARVGGGVLVVVQFLARGTLYWCVWLFRGTLAFLDAFRWWILLVVVVLGALALYFGLVGGFDDFLGWIGRD